MGQRLIDRLIVGLVGWFTFPDRNVMYFWTRTSDQSNRTRFVPVRHAKPDF